mmetsp:Transcript_24640/g.24872  ORF Transcript_24640/g.24872 Transcript_24640/m.24872 type:complete len:481 (-) Transcript_24640:46-1488(-)
MDNSKVKRRSARIAAVKVNENISKESVDKAEKHDSKISSVAESSSKPIHFEFGGPIGVFFVIFGLPLVIYMLYFGCNSEYCITNPLDLKLSKITHIIQTTPLLTYDAFMPYVSWMGFHILLERILPCEVVEGVELPDNSKTRLKYNISGHLQFWITMIAMFHCVPVFKESPLVSWSISRFVPLLPLNIIYDNYVSLISISIIGSYLLSIYLYITSFLPGKLLAKGGNTGYHLYDFFIGRELNPRIYGFDLKEFCELRPGLIGWLALNIGMALKQYERNGHLSGSMFLIVLFQGIYVWDALYQEKAILTTMDITTDGFGYMLAFGDLSWVPFIYSFQARYLVDYDPSLSPLSLSLIIALHSIGFYIFRAANSQKDLFRRDPNHPQVAHLQYMRTKRGTKLLISGWWGAARKINYTGDFLVTLSWCLLCGFNSPLPYFQALYFAILLVHRAIRDDKMCTEKYEEDWSEYKKQVPYMFIPYLV